MKYDEFIKEKVNFDSTYGFKIDPTEINPILKPHQRDIVEWAINGGYFLDGVKYLQAEENRKAMPSLFDVEQVTP